MATIKTRTIDGSEAGTLDLADAVFGVEPNTSAVRIALNGYLSNQRRGTHSTKTRHFVSGGGKKPWKQKHTGRARQGSIRATQWRGGAIAFGPSPRDYTYRLNKKLRQNALKAVLSDLVRSERLIIVDDFKIEEAKTKQVAGILEALGVRGSALLLTGPDDALLLRAARNIPYVDCLSVESPNIFDLLNHDYVIASAAAIQRLEGVHA